MIELLLAADRLVAAGELDHAEWIYRQVIEADPRNAIAVVGLAQVAEARGAHSDAAALARHALDIDPDDEAARRLVEAIGARMPVPPSVAPLAGQAEAPVPRPSILSRLRSLLGLGR